jgi:prolyl-tRNA synthetase
MKQSMMFIPTLREVPADADVKSHQLLLRAGFIRQNSAGVYTFLPLGKKVLQKVEQIVREEMDRAGAVEMFMPALQLAELWQESGRWYSYGPEMMRVKDRHNRDFALGPTHEEMITSLVRDEVNSYKKLPLTLYQIQTKFRDEKRPRFGLLRGKEFIMKDAYSFHSSFDSLDVVYQGLFEAYSNVFSRCGLNYRAVIADSGAMGGKDTHEFMVLSDIGEDTIAYSDSSNYAANVEMAPVITTYEKNNSSQEELQKIDTPGQKSIEEVSTFLRVSPEQCLKSIMFKVDDQFVLVVVRGDHEINDVKIKNIFNASVVELATSEETKNAVGPVGSLGPINVPDSLKIVADHAVEYMVNGVCGANVEGVHYTGVNPDRDLENVQYEDVRFIMEGDPSPDGKGTIVFAKGIEVGHVFKLGTRYSEAMNATFLDENGKTKPMIMGCYGIGVSRTVAAIAEQYNDENGLVWPQAVAPYDLHLIVVNPKLDDQKELADELYTSLKSKFEVLYDDRQERPGVKFADSDLMGLPIRITVGKRAGDGVIELKVRSTGEVLEITTENLIETIEKYIVK